MLSPGEVALVNGYNPYSEQNIDIYVHTLVTPSTLIRQNQQQEISQNVVISNNNDVRNNNLQNTTIQRNPQRSRTSDMSIQTGINEEIRQNHNIINNIASVPINNQSSLFNRATQNNNINNNSSNNNMYTQGNNNLENIMTMISNSKFILFNQIILIIEGVVWVVKHHVIRKALFRKILTIR